VAHTCYFGGARWCRDCGDGVMVEVVVTRETIAADIAALRVKQERLPAHWQERREELAEQIETLVLDWLATGTVGD
jgi:hypothetical protein